MAVAGLVSALVFFRARRWGQCETTECKLTNEKLYYLQDLLFITVENKIDEKASPSITNCSHCYDTEVAPPEIFISMVVPKETCHRRCGSMTQDHGAIYGWPLINGLDKYDRSIGILSTGMTQNFKILFAW